MVVIAVLGSLSFSIGRVSLARFTQVARLEDSLNAYQAASAGIEDGLLRFRFSNTVQAPLACPTADSPTTSTQFFVRTDIATGQTTTCVDSTSSAPPVADTVYDMKVYHTLDQGVAEIQATVTNARGTFPALKQDQSVEYDVSNTQDTVQVSWVFANPGALNALEIIPLDQSGSVVRSEKRFIRGSASGNTSIKVTGVSTLRIRPFGSDLKRYTLTPAAGQSISSRDTYIESTGYFGRSKRKLKITLDRLSGSIQELYDFVLFSGSGNIVGPGTP